MMTELPPGIILILGAILVPFLRGNLRNIYMLALPIIGLSSLLLTSQNYQFEFNLFGYNISPVRFPTLDACC